MKHPIQVKKKKPKLSQEQQMKRRASESAHFIISSGDPKEIAKGSFDEEEFKKAMVIVHKSRETTL